MTIHEIFRKSGKIVFHRITTDVHQLLQSDKYATTIHLN